MLLLSTLLRWWNAWAYHSSEGDRACCCDVDTEDDDEVAEKKRAEEGQSKTGLVLGCLSIEDNGEYFADLYDLKQSLYYSGLCYNSLDSKF